MLNSPGAVPYLNGIRGIAAFLVFVHHFLLSFYPAHYTFDAGMSHLNGLDVLFGKSVFSVFVNGNFCVCIFFVLSGFVLSRSYYHTRDIHTPVAAMYRRFVRLYVPVAITLMLAAILVKSSAFYNTQAAALTHSEWWLGGMWHIDNPGELLVRSLAYDVMFNGNNILDTSMWTISFELYGSLLVFAFLIVSHYAKYRALVMLVLLYYFYITQGGVYFAFMLGITLCDIEKYGRLTNNYKTVGSIVMILIALVLGSFPSNGAMEGTLFARLGHALLQYKFWFHTVGAYLLVLAFVLTPYLQSVAGRRIFVYLGYISFSLYLLHPLVLGSFSSWLFLHLNPLVSYHIAVLVVLAGTILVVLPLSWLMTRFIDEPGIALAGVIAHRIMIARPANGDVMLLKGLYVGARHKIAKEEEVSCKPGNVSGKNTIA